MRQPIHLSVCRDVRHVPAPAHLAAGPMQDPTGTKVRQTVIRQSRFGGRCVFCDFAFGDGGAFDVHHLDGDHTHQDPDNLVPACTLCHAPFHLDLVSQRWRDGPGRIIFLPELSQVHLNNLLQVIFFAKVEQEAQGMRMTGSTDDGVASVPESPVLHATSLYLSLARRADYVERLPDGSPGRPGLSQPAVLAKVLKEMSDEEYAQRDQLLHGLRYLPDESWMLDQARQWKAQDSAFTQLDVSNWASIAGMVA